MAWLEITIDTTAEKINSVVTVLTAKGFSDLVIEDQQEFESFLEDNRAYWDYIDEKFIAEVTEDYEIFDYVGKPTRKMRFRIARQYLIYAACLVLLACAMPIVSYIVPQIGEIFGGNAGNIGDTETLDLGEFADMSERDLIEHVGKVPKRFKEIVEKNIFRKNFSSDDYVYISFLYEDNPMRNYDVYFFDSGTMTLYYFHNNI